MQNSSKQSSNSYTLARVVLHWLIALSIFGLFASGFWMVELDYYSEWYTKAPHWHKSVGLLLFVVLCISFIWRHSTEKPLYEPGVKNWEILSAKWVQALMSALTLLIVVTGYLITTANGDPVSLFNWFDIPALISDIKNQEDITGKLHKWMAYVLIAFACLHASAALYHHIIKKDRTLLKMLSK